MDERRWSRSRAVLAARPLPRTPVSGVSPMNLTTEDTPSAGRKEPSTGSKLIIGAGVLLVAFYLLWNTNFGKRLTAQLGVRECYEVTLTGQVVCGEQADRIERFKERFAP